MRECENVYAVGDSVGMCRFTTKLFNSPSLPGLEQFAAQIANVTGFAFSEDDLQQIGLNIMGVERMINHRLGVRRAERSVSEPAWHTHSEAGRMDLLHRPRLQSVALVDRYSQPHSVAVLRVS